MQDETGLNKENFENYLSLEKKIQDPNSARQFRAQVEQEYRAELRQLGSALHDKALEISELKSEIMQIRTEFYDYRQVNEEALKAAKMVVNAGLVFKWMVVAVVGLTAAVSGIAQLLEHIHRWAQKP